MGTWAEGLYDNDSALDNLDELFETLDPTVDAAHLAGTVGLLLQLSSSTITVEPEEWQATIQGSAHLAELPPAAREVLERIAEDPEAAAEGRSRPPAHLELLGGYLDGPRYEPLFAVPGVDAVIAELAEVAMASLDNLLDQIPEELDLYELAGDLAPLGLLLDLQVGVAPGRLAKWKGVFASADEQTTDERDFWDKYVASVRGVFELLEGRASGNPATSA